MSNHILTAEMQPATLFIDACGPEPFTVEIPAGAIRYCWGCHRRRRVKNLKVQVFYDSTRFWCDGGCAKTKRKRRARK